MTPEFKEDLKNIYGIDEQFMLDHSASSIRVLLGYTIDPHVDSLLGRVSVVVDQDNKILEISKPYKPTHIADYHATKSMTVEHWSSLGGTLSRVILNPETLIMEQHVEFNNHTLIIKYEVAHE